MLFGVHHQRLRYMLTINILVCIPGCADIPHNEALEAAVPNKSFARTTASPGESCAPGCIWSAYAIIVGAQDDGSVCGEHLCACVAQNDIYTHCTPASRDSSPLEMANDPAMYDPFSSENNDETCSDGIDNDNDGRVDCEDTDCLNDIAVSVCWWSVSPEDSDRTCNDRVDNDGDGFIDCDDLSCGQNASVTVCEQAEVRHNRPSASIGATCAAGCIWSTQAVALGAQPTGGQCDGQGCACVKRGDIYTSCDGVETTTPTAEEVDEPVVVPSATPQSSYNASVGNRIADEAYRIATQRNTIGYCYSAAADAIESVTGSFLWGQSAYMAADQLAVSRFFREGSPQNLAGLPAGAVVVWGRGSSPHGHISIALGDGREASDHVAPQMTYHYGGAPARVFLPY